jgi:uncharacterized protein YjbI with pentapeptide repeats
MIDLSLLTIEAIKQSITAYNEEPWYNHELLSSGRYIKIVENIYHKKGFYTDVKEDLIKNIFENVDWDGITINDFKIKSLGGKVQNCIFNNVQILHFSLEDGKCVKCNFLNSKIKGMHDHFNFISCSFSNQCSILYINRVHFKNCDFDNCRFDNHNSTYNFKDNSTITNCSFHCGFIKVDQSTVMDCGLTDVQIELSGSKINKSHFKESRLNFQGTWLVPSWYSGCIIEGSRIGLLNPPSFVKCSFPETSIGSGGNTFDISNFDNCDFKEAIYGATITPEDLVLLKNWVYIKDVPNGVLARLDLKDLMKYRKFNKIKGGDLSLLGDGLEGALSKAEPELKKPTAKPKRKSLWERIRRKKSK